MESTDSSSGSPQPQLPPGFRFHPTDEELVVHYLKKKASSAPLPVAIIAEVDLYKFDPWELPAKASFGEQEWYFFSPRDRKYPNGARPNRAATSGYWKATGTDKPILTSGGTQKVGVKKALVFYGGKPPKGIKTNWIMHEYRLTDNNRVNHKPPGCDFGNKRNSLRLDDWVLCRIYKKNNIHRPMENDKDESMEEMMLGTIPKVTNYTTIFENEQTLFEGILNNNNNDGTISQIPSSSSNPSTMSNPNFTPKRTLPSLYWTEEDAAEPPSTKRFHGENHGGARLDDTTSISTLLSQQQAMLGSLEDGFFGHHINFLA